MWVQFRKYSWNTLAGDVSGGFVAALIALPYGLAIATLMGLPPMLGLFTSILTGPITAMLGRNPVLIGGVSSATVPFIAAAVQAQGVGGAAKISIVAATIMLVFSVLRLGRFASMVPYPVMAGFSCGIGGMMVITQLRTIFGLKFATDSQISMVELLSRNLQNISGIQWTTSATALIVIAAAFALAHYWPKLPAPLFGILAAVAVSNVFGWSSREIGVLPHSVPPLAGFAWAPGDAVAVLPGALALAFVASANLLVTSRVVEHFRGRHKHLKMADADRELGAYGIANLAAGMFGAPMSVGIPARSLANVRCGGSTRFSNFAHAIFLLIFITMASNSISHIPVSALAGVTAWMGFSLMGWGAWSRLSKMRRVDALGFLSTAVGVLMVNAVAAIAIGCSFYGLRYVYNWLKAGERPLPEPLTNYAGESRRPR